MIGVHFFIVGPGYTGECEDYTVKLASPPREGDAILLPQYEETFVVNNVTWIFDEHGFEPEVHLTLVKDDNENEKA